MLLSNADIRLEFDAQGRLLRLENPKSGRNYLTADGCELFRLTLVETFEGRVQPGLLRLTPETAKEVKILQGSNTLQISFLRLDGFAIDVTA